MPKLHIDIETYSSEDIKKTGAYAYAQSPDFEILMVAYAYGDEPVKVHDLLADEELPADLVAGLQDPNVTKGAHNATFERWCFQQIGYPTSPEEWECTQIKAAYCGLPHSLGEVSKALELKQFGKAATGKALIKYFCGPCKPTKTNGGRHRNLPEHSPEKWQEFIEYCRQDVVAEREVGRRLSKYKIPAFEWDNYRLDQKINDRGVALDLKLAANATEIDNAYKAGLRARFTELTGIEKTGSLPQLKRWLSDSLGKEITTLKKEVLPALLAEAEGSAAFEVLNLRKRMGKTSTAKYKAVLASAGTDSRGRGYIQHYGAGRTGRSAGRLLQVQNLPQDHLGDKLELARHMATHSTYEQFVVEFPDVASTLSQLIRTVIQAEEDYLLAAADFSAIEARVTAWLAGEKWRLDVFRTHGKIYEASAAAMFGVPIESIGKGSPLRARGKVSELALGYQGGKGALAVMEAALRVPEEDRLSIPEKVELIRKWRLASPAIVEFWAMCERSALQAMRTGRVVESPCGRLRFKYDGKVLRIRLPSSRCLFYYGPRIGVNQWNRPSLQYRGVDQKTRQWSYLDTYGGKLCLSASTKVLSSHGWKYITDITAADLVFDGREWVSSDGCIYNGDKPTINVSGVSMTADHKVLTNEGWKAASSCEGHNRVESRLPNSGPLCGLKWQKIPMASPLYMRSGDNPTCLRATETSKAKDSSLLRMQTQRDHRTEEDYARYDEAPGLRSLPLYASPLQQPNAQSLPQLRRPGYRSLRKLAKRVFGFLGRYAGELLQRLRPRQTRQQRGLQPSKLSLGYSGEELQQPQKLYESTRPNGKRVRQTAGSSKDYDILQNTPRLTVRSNEGLPEPVYDLVNCGPRNRFVVQDENGLPLIVHNCENIVQAVARDLLFFSMRNLDKHDFYTLMHVHDEAVARVPIASAEDDLKRMCAIMEEPPPWAQDCPLKVAGFVNAFYKK